MKPIKVLQVFTVLNIGGAETNLMNYYRKINPNEIQMDFLVHREGGFFEAEIIERGSKIYRLPPITPFNLRNYITAVDNFFKKHAKDYDIVHGQLSELGVYIYEAAKKYGIPVRIAHAHNSTMDWDLKAPVRFWYKYKMRTYINGFFSCGNESSKWLFGNKIANKTFIMPNSINVDEFVYQENIVKKYQTDLQISTPYTFLHIGRFSKQKNHHFLIDVFHLLLQKLPDAKLFLVGLGELEHEIESKVLEKGLSNSIFFLGRRTDVNILMQTCNYFIFPSLFEGFGIAFLEAQASGMYCFVSDKIEKSAHIVSEQICELELNKSSTYWAETIYSKLLESNCIPNRNIEKKIKEAGYDVTDNVSALYNEYKRLLDKNK